MFFVTFRHWWYNKMHYDLVGVKRYSHWNRRRNWSRRHILCLGNAHDVYWQSFTEGSKSGFMRPRCALCLLLHLMRCNWLWAFSHTAVYSFVHIPELQHEWVNINDRSICHEVFFSTSDCILSYSELSYSQTIFHRNTLSNQRQSLDLVAWHSAQGARRVPPGTHIQSNIKWQDTCNKRTLLSARSSLPTLPSVSLFISAPPPLWGE